MVLEIPKSEWIKLSHKERRGLINKERRRRRRQRIAAERADRETELEKLMLQPEYMEKAAAEEREAQRQEAERQLQNEAWLERDRKSHAEFCEKKEKEEQKLREREEREKMIREEWEALERKEKGATEKKDKNKSKKEALLAEALSEIDQTMQEQGTLLDVHVPWHNPYAPIDMTQVAKAMNLLDDEDDDEKQKPSEQEQPQKPERDNYGTEKDRINCPFFIKTGACRYGDHCSRIHPIPNSSTTLIIRGMYSHVVLTQQLLDEHDEDVGLEMDDEDMLKDFKEFYEDVFPEFEKFGEVIQFKVSCNFESHLRGNLYVQYATEEACAEAIKQFNGRYYAGKQLSCEFCPVEKWKTAICGEFLKQGNQCPKGKHCNFLHVFINPDGKFNWSEEDTNNRSRVRSRSPGRRYAGRGRGRGRGRDGGFRRRYSRSPPNRRHYKRGSVSPRDRRRRRSVSPSNRRRSPRDRRGSRNHRSRSPRDRRSPSPYRRERRGRRHSSSDYSSNERSSSSYDSDSDLSPVRKGSEKDKRGSEKDRGSKKGRKGSEKERKSSSSHRHKKNKKHKSSKKKHKRRDSSSSSDDD